MSDFCPELYAIDFGTSNSLLSAANRRSIHPPIPLDPDADDPTILRSISFFPEENGDGQKYAVGRSALHEYVAHGSRGRLLRSLKRFLPVRGFTRTQIGSASYSLEELIAVMLRELRLRANAFFNADVRRVLLGRPARFSPDPEEDALAETRLGRAAVLAGFERVSFCPEPVAAARDFRGELALGKLMLVGDFGAGTSDFSLVRLGPSGFELAAVLATFGVAVAGDALDGSLMRGKIARNFGSAIRYRVPFGDNVLSMPRPLLEKLCSPAEMSLLGRRDVRAFLEDVRSWSLERRDRGHIDQLLTLVDDTLGFVLFERIEQAKKELSAADRVQFSFHVPGIDVEEELAREEFEAGARRELEAIVRALDTTLELGGVAAEDVDLVCLTGGTARVPFVQAYLRERFGPAKLHALSGLHAVAEGLARHAQRELTAEP